MPLAAPCNPRKMFPPPMTIPIWQPRRATPAICEAYSPSLCGSIPYACPPISDSPLNLSKILEYFILLSFFNSSSRPAGNSAGHPDEPNCKSTKKSVPRGITISKHFSSNEAKPATITTHQHSADASVSETPIASNRRRRRLPRSTELKRGSVFSCCFAAKAGYASAYPKQAWLCARPALQSVPNRAKPKRNRCPYAAFWRRDLNPRPMTSLESLTDTKASGSASLSRLRKVTSSRRVKETYTKSRSSPW